MKHCICIDPAGFAFTHEAHKDPEATAVLFLRHRMIDYATWPMQGDDLPPHIIAAGKPDMPTDGGAGAAL